MLIAQISDLHITREGELLPGGADSAASLRAVVAALCALDPEPAAVLATGDLTEHADPAEYARLRRLLAPLAMPVLVLPGNHDRREPLRRAFAQDSWMPAGAGEPIRYTLDVGRLRIVVLDTLVEGSEHGRLGASQLTWLDHVLAAASRPTVIALHHPPVNSGIRAMDAMRLADAAALGEVVARHACVERLVCGHLHRTMHVRWCGSVVSVAPSTVEQTALRLAPDAALAASGEPPGFQLHFRDDADGLVTHTVTVGSGRTGDR